MNRVKLSPGTYKAITEVVLSQYHHNQQLNYRTVAAGNTFEVPASVNGFGYFVIYYPDFGDKRPEFAAA